MSFKKNVSQAFNNAANLYDQFAFIQSQTAFLISDIVRHLTLKNEKYEILEIGCGTGFVGQFMLPDFQNTSFTFSDISSEMIKKTKERLGDKHKYLVMDGENPNLEPESYDLIISSLSFQWFEDLENGVNNLLKLLRSGGAIVFSIFGDQSFSQWKNAHKKLGFSCGMHDFPSIEELQNKFKNADFSEKFIQQSIMTGKDFAKSLNLIGAKTPKSNHSPLTITQIKKVFKEFEKNSEITNQIIFGIIKK